MFLPQYSIRWLFVATAVMAALSLIGSFAYREDAWALALIGGIVAMFLMFAGYAVSWIVAMALGGLVRLVRRERHGPDSPFATHKAAPQVLEPQENNP